MSLQSEATMTSEEESLEDVLLELMKETGFLANVKGHIAKFIADSGKLSGDKYIMPERANEQTLTYIYEYLQWIGMRQTCSVLLSESPVKVDTTSIAGVKHSNPDYRPKLHTLLKNQPSELDSKFLSFRKSEELIIPVSKSSSSFMYKTPSARSFDDLLDSKNSEPSLVKHINSVDDSLLTSTPAAAADATFIKNGDSKDEIDSSLLMGFETPVVSTGTTAKSNREKSSFVPEKLFQNKDDPFQALLRKHEQEEDEDDIIAKPKTLPISSAKVPTAEGESPTTAQVSKSVEQFIEEEERLRALQDQDEDLKKMEDEVMESSISTDWSEEGPNKPDNDNDNESLNLEEIDVKVGDDADNDRSKKYEFSDDFEEDKDSSSNNNYLRNQMQNKEASAEPSIKSNQNQTEELDIAHSKSHNSDGKEDVISNGNISAAGGDKENILAKATTQPKKSDVSGEADDISTSDILSMSIDMEAEDEDTKDVSIPSDSLGMSSCDHAVNIK